MNKGDATPYSLGHLTAKREASPFPATYPVHMPVSKESDAPHFECRSFPVMKSASAVLTITMAPMIAAKTTGRYLIFAAPSAVWAQDRPRRADTVPLDLPDG